MAQSKDAVVKQEGRDGIKYCPLRKRELRSLPRPWRTSSLATLKSSRRCNACASIIERTHGNCEKTMDPTDQAAYESFRTEFVDIGGDLAREEG